MAKIGAGHLCFAPWENGGDATTAPTFKNGVQLNKLASANLNITYSEGEYYADDEVAEEAREFLRGDLEVEIDRLEPEQASAVFDSTYDEETGLVDSTEDNAPFGGIAYYQTLVQDGKKSYRVRHYPKARGVLGADNSTSKGSSITFAGEPLSFRVYRPENGKWRITKYFDTLEAAVSYIDTTLSVATATS